MDPIGYRNKIYGDESTELVEVYALDFDEQVTRDLVTRHEDDLRRLAQLTSGKKLTPSQKGKRAELEAVLEELRSACRHRVFNDEAGFLYALRKCSSCDTHMGSV